MRVIGVAAIVLLAAYLADQTFSHGRYTYATVRTIVQMRHSFGIQGRLSWRPLSVSSAAVFTQRTANA